MTCCLCLRTPPELLELPYGPICPQCLTEHLQRRPLDDAAALLCAPILDNTQGGNYAYTPAYEKSL